MLFARQYLHSRVNNHPFRFSSNPRDAFQVPLVCVNDNYPPEFLNNDGTLNFPDFLPPRSDFNIQARHTQRQTIAL